MHLEQLTTLTLKEMVIKSDDWQRPWVFGGVAVFEDFDVVGFVFSHSFLIWFWVVLVSLYSC